MFNPTGKKRAEGEYGRTIQNCRSFAARYGCGTLLTCNLFARKNHPDGENEEELPNPPDPDKIRQENDRYIAEIIGKADIVVCAWGNGPRKLRAGLVERVRQVVQILEDKKAHDKLYALVPEALYRTVFTRHGQPRHPLSRGKDRIDLSKCRRLRIQNGKLLPEKEREHA